MAAPPKKLNSRHMTMAALVACDLTDREVAKRLGMSHHTVKITKQSPLFQLEVRRLKKDQTDKISNNYVDQVMHDGERNVTFLKKVRDGKLADFDEMAPADRVRLRMSAALPLFERQMPRQKDGEQVPTINIVLQKNEQVIMAEAARDVGAQIPQLDTVIAEYEQQERDALTAAN